MVGASLQASWAVFAQAFEEEEEMCEIHQPLGVPRPSNLPRLCIVAMGRKALGVASIYLAGTWGGEDSIPASTGGEGI